MINTSFHIGNSNVDIEWDGINLNITGFYRDYATAFLPQEKRRGFLPNYGDVEAGIYQESGGYIIIPRADGGGTWFRINISREEAQLIINALESQAGELTAADFYPERVEEILRRVQAESSPANPQQLG